MLNKQIGKNPFVAYFVKTGKRAGRVHAIVTKRTSKRATRRNYLKRRIRVIVAKFLEQSQELLIYRDLIILVNNPIDNTQGTFESLKNYINQVLQRTTKLKK